jgi:hypothetical protein
MGRRDPISRCKNFSFAAVERGSIFRILSDRAQGQAGAAATCSANTIKDGNKVAAA